LPLLLEEALCLPRFQVFDLCKVPSGPVLLSNFPSLLSLFGSGLSGLGGKTIEVNRSDFNREDQGALVSIIQKELRCNRDV